MPLGKRHSCWPPMQMERGASYWPRKGNRAPTELIEACWHEALGIFGLRPPQGSKLSLTFYPFQNFLASREQLHRHPHDHYRVAFERFVVNGTCLYPQQQRGPYGGMISDVPEKAKETVAKGMEHLMHAIFGGQPVEHAPYTPIPSDANCTEPTLIRHVACQNGL